MAATERRVGSSRRGMTVLGKVPVVPKPINLPSQRLENRGLFPDVDIVPRGTCSWGSAGQFPGASGNKSRKSDSTSSNPLSGCGEQENCGKVEGKPVSSTSSGNPGVKGGGGLRETSIQFLPAKANPVQALDSNGKIEEPRNSNSYARNSLDSRKQEATETPLQKSDGYVRGVSVPPGFGHCGPHGNHSRADVSTSDLQYNGIGPGMYPNTSQQNGLHSFPGVPQHNGKKEREIIVIHMVGGPGYYGNYPPQLGYPDNYSRNGSYGNFPLQFGNFEPYFGFQGHGRLDGGAQISAVTGSDLFDEHDFVCYEKECYQGRHKNGLVRGSFQESTFLGGAQRDVHEALISRSSLKSRSTSQKHLSRNVGRLRSLYNNGRLVPIEEAPAVPVPEKRITLLTKVSQHKMLTTKSLEETDVGKAAHTEGVVDSVFSACGDEGKAPETFEADIVIEDAQVGKTGAFIEDAQVEKTVASASLKMADEMSLPKETELGVSVSTATCNDKCLYCKAEASTSQCCLRLTEEVPVESIDKSNSTDGCAVEVKHVIFDADSCGLSTIKGQEDASLSSLMEAAAADELLDTQSSTTLQKTPIQNNQEENGKQSLWGKKGITDGKWKPKRSVGAAKMDFKVFAPKIRKAAIRKNTSKTFANECVSEASSSSAMCNKKDSMSNMGADSTTLPSETETCKMQCQESSSPSSLSSSRDVPVDDSHVFSKEKPNGAAFLDFIASEERAQKKKGKNSRKTTLHKDCHDNVATFHPVGSLVKTVFEDTSGTEVQKQESKGEAEKAWRPKLPTALQSKLATKVSGIRVSKAHVDPRKLGIQGGKSHSVVGSTFSAKSSEVVKEQGDAVQKISSPSTSQLCNSEVLKTDTNQSFKGLSKNRIGGQQNLVFRKRSVEQAALGHQSSRDTSNIKQPIGSLAASSKGEFGLEHTKQSLYSASSCHNNLADANFSVSASKYHMIRRRVYHVVGGSGRDYVLPAGKSHQTGNHKSLQKGSMQNQKQLQKKTVFLSSQSSYCTESEHSEEFPDSMCMLEINSCSSGSEGIPHLEQAGVAVNQHMSGSLLSSSGSEESISKKHVRPGKGSSAWKPKAAPETRVLENIFPKPDNIETLIPTHGDGSSKGIIDSASSSQVSASSHLHAGENNEEHTIENLCGVPLELESVCHQTLEETNHLLNQEDALLSSKNKEINHPLNQEDTLVSSKNKEVMDSQNLSEIVVSMKETEHGSVQKHAEEVSPLESLCLVRISKEEEVPVLKQISQTCSQENTSNNCRPFFKKKNVMSYEKANRYHQIMFKKYKQVGLWKPKVELHRKVLEENDCASQNDIEAPMKVVLMVA